jgi:holo-[acyl-carrier protein] synthase
MIVGTGVDIIEVNRVAEAIERFGERFLTRIFTESEIRYCNAKRNRVERFAARFAAKEAAMKALGTGLRRGVSWQHIEVGHLPGGRPTIIFTQAAAQIAAQLGAKHVSLSVSHTEEHAIAQVILEN